MIIACICGGVGEFCIGAAILSAIVCAWKKWRERKSNPPSKHNPDCKCHCHTNKEQCTKLTGAGEKTEDPGMPIPPKEELTCFKCDEKDTCKYAWDLYNTDGDCLANK